VRNRTDTLVRRAQDRLHCLQASGRALTAPRDIGPGANAAFGESI
jgi:hypothetical protein